jgi:hypothetical protein
MATSDKREPAVYVSIEDKSYIGPPTEIGRVVYGVILCDRGPDNRIIEITSQKQYQKIFGTPNIQRCSQTHYILNKCLEYTGKVLACRVMPANAEIANAVISVSSTSSASSGSSFKFSSEAYDVYKTLFVTMQSVTPNTIGVGTKTFIGETGKSFQEDDIIKLTYNYTDENGYIEQNIMTGVITSYNSSTGVLVATITSVIGEGTFPDAIPGHPTSWTITLNSQFESEFVYGQMTCLTTDVDELAIGQWIYSDADTSPFARQIVSITEGPTATTVVLDAPYEGSTVTSGIYFYTPYTISNIENITSPSNIDEDGSYVYHFYAIGSGVYYNNITIKCSRNYEMERMYVDDNGTPFFPFIFADFYVYVTDEYGTQNLVEGPWTVSLVRKTPDNQVIKDFMGGLPTYIEDVINTNSQFVRVKSGSQVDDLSATGEVAEKKRLQLMLTLLREQVVGLTNIGSDGMPLAEGSDGTGLYEALTGNINPSASLYGRIANAYRGSLQSIDGSIEALPEAIYPTYEFDYIVTGGFPISVQYGALELASGREDCHHIGDTGANYNNYLYDIQARQQIAAWNKWTSSLYVQYRKIFDDYTGKSFWMTPVYHAIIRHLDTDNKYFLGEPACNIEKGAIEEAVQLAYQTNHTIRGDLFDKELNYTINEKNGVYFATQFTTWKRYSALKRQHIAKFVSYLKRQIPYILRDIIQRKATIYWLSQANFRMNNLFLKYLDGKAIDRYACVNSYSVVLEFDKTRSELNVYVTFAPILAIERINVFLTIPAEL